MNDGMVTGRIYIVFAGVMILAGLNAAGQGLRFDNHRDVKPPEYATLRLGPFYSTVEFSQSAGYRYIQSGGAGTDFLEAEGRGVILEDGSDFPLETRIDFRNYLMITRKTDLDMSIAASYEHYPMETQEDEFNAHLVDEGIYGSLSMGVMISPYLRGTAYEDAVYRTDYIDTRGIYDPYGGAEYEYFSNKIGVDMDWLMSKSMNLGLSLSRVDFIPSDDEYEEQERVSYNESLLYEYEIYDGLITGVRGDFTQTDYTDPDRQDTLLEDYSVFFRLGEDEGARIRLTEASSLTVRLGYSQGYDWSSSETNENEQSIISGEVELRTRMRRDLIQEIGYRRRLEGGFRSSFDKVDAAYYRLYWNGKLSSAGFRTEFTEVEPSSSEENSYRNWLTGIDAGYPLTPYIRLLFSSVYTVRDNRNSVDGVDEEWANDYDTWSSRLGTSFGVTKKIDFSTYIQHVERVSDSDDLEYTRDTFAATFTFSHRL